MVSQEEMLKTLEEMLKTFKQDRYVALMSLDIHVIAQYCAKWGVPPGANPLVAWASVHKARLALPEIPEAEKELSRQWLLKNGFDPLPPH